MYSTHYTYTLKNHFKALKLYIYHITLIACLIKKNPSQLSGGKQQRVWILQEDNFYQIFKFIDVNI
jgi:ABC-type lipoprotein export system ATPase subunit